jgi:hypothetical protein
VRSLASEADTVETLADQFISTTPPMVAAREGMPPDAFERYADEVRELIRERAADHDGPARLESEYMLIVARKRESRKQPARPAARTGLG